MISAATIEDTAFQLMAKAGIEIPDDYLSGIKRMAVSSISKVWWRSAR